MCLQAAGHEGPRTQIYRQDLMGVYRVSVIVFMLPVAVKSDLHYDSSVITCSIESPTIA